MQLLESVLIQSASGPDDRPLGWLQDIANQVQIEPNFCIRHPDYKPLELPAEVVDRFQRLPLSLQHKYQALQLRSFLYGIYYNSSLRKALSAESDSTELNSQPDLENNTFQGVDLKFYEQLHASNRGKGYFDPDWKVLRQEIDGTLAVRKDDLTLHIERDRHLPSEQQSAAVGDLVAIRLPANRVQSGFYLAVSNVSSRDRSNSDPAEWVRIYFHITPEGAVALMDALTQRLNDIALPFQFKALYNPSDYDRYDSAVLYFEKRDYEAVRQVLQVVYPAQRSHFQPEIPLFTRFLAPGLALAEEPDQKFVTKESFGTHRCQIVANGLLEAWKNTDNRPEDRMAAILQEFSCLQIDVKHPYLNPNSKDIYTPLEQCESPT